MRTNIVIDDDLMREALELSGLTTKRAAVENALRFSIRMSRQKLALAELHGSDPEWQGDLDAMRRD